MKRQKSKEVFGDALMALAKTAPVERITVKQIVEKSGLSLQTFYNHFRDKEDLVRWVHQWGSERMLARLEGKNYSFHDMTMDNIRFYAQNANYLRADPGDSIVNHYAELSAQNTYNLLAGFICRRHGFRELPEELDFYLRMYVYACLHIFAQWSFQSWDMPEERLAAYLEEGMPEKLKPYLLG